MVSALGGGDNQRKYEILSTKSVGSRCLFRISRLLLERWGFAALPPVGVVLFGLLRLFLFLRLVVIDVVVERVVAVAARFGVRVVFAIAGFGTADAGCEDRKSVVSVRRVAAGGGVC